MAQDDTYQVDVYKQRPGDTLNIGSDGTLTVWSGGEIMGNSLGYMSCEDGFEFFFNDQTISAARMLNYLVGRARWSVIHVSGAAGTLSAMGGSEPPVLPSMQGFIVFSCEQGANDNTSLACRMPSAHIGEELVIMMRGDASLTSVMIHFSGVTSTLNISGVACIGQSEGPLSMIRLYNSNASFGLVRLVGVEDGTWAVIDNGYSRGDGGSVNEEPAG